MGLIRCDFGENIAKAGLVNDISRIGGVSRFLDHSSLAVTTSYLRQLEGDRDWTWEQVAMAIGVAN